MRVKKLIFRLLNKSGITPTLEESDQIIYYAFGRRDKVNVRKVEDLITTDPSPLKTYLETIELKNQQNFKSPEEYFKTLKWLLTAFPQNLEDFKKQHGN